MDLLKQELLRKRKAVELAKKSSDVGRLGNQDPTSKKRTYFKAADVRRFQEKQAEEEEEKKKRKLISKKSDGKKSKKKRVGENDNKTNSGSKDVAEKKSSNKSKNRGVGEIKSDGTESNKDPKNTSDDGDNDEETLPTMSSSELTNALRDLGIPVWLFGEKDDSQRMQRLKEAKESRKAAMAGLSEMDEFKLGSGHGIRNPFIGKAKDGDLDLKATSTSNEKNSDTKNDDRKKGSAKDEPEEEEDTNDPHKTIHRFFKTLLRQWEDDLANRPDAVKRTAIGKNETKTLKQCKDYIRPLFKLCKNRTLEENIMGSLMKIVNFCKEGEFVKANDVYMDVAIGRAAWPIGVTMVGIHQRSGRERINADKVAHVMNSELQRKYLTSVKRLMTYCQKKRPDVDPSKKVTNV